MTTSLPDKILSSEKVEIKPYFKEQYQKILGPRYDEFMDYSFRYIRKCIRVNTLKTDVTTIRDRLTSQGWILTPVPWCTEGFFIEGHKDVHRFDIGNLVEHDLGYFYVQEAASMLPPVVLFSDVRSKEVTAERQNPEQPMAVLDLCAAPGSKTSQIAQYLHNEGLLIANDVDVSRLRPLALNLQRMGITNALVTLNAFQKSKQSTKPRNPFGDEPFFDKILVDAPCSGTGTIRRSFKMLDMYSAGFVRRLVAIQRALIVNAFNLLKPGGVMVYSTCSQEPAENEGVVSYLLEKFPQAELLDITLSIVRSEPIMEFDGQVMHPEVKKCLRIYPQDNNSEGFFVAKIRKH
jgi:NOL1/NOP2/sun family putative RNA methylase